MVVVLCGPNGAAYPPRARRVEHNSPYINRHPHRGVQTSACCTSYLMGFLAALCHYVFMRRYSAAHGTHCVSRRVAAAASPSGPRRHIWQAAGTPSRDRGGLIPYFARASWPQCSPRRRRAGGGIVFAVVAYRRPTSPHWIKGRRFNIASEAKNGPGEHRLLTNGAHVPAQVVACSGHGPERSSHDDVVGGSPSYSQSAIRSL